MSLVIGVSVLLVELGLFLLLVVGIDVLHGLLVIVSIALLNCGVFLLVHRMSSVALGIFLRTSDVFRQPGEVQLGHNRWLAGSQLGSVHEREETVFGVEAEFDL